MQDDDGFESRLAKVETLLAELGSAILDSMVLQAEFMTWVAENAQLGVPKHARQAVDFSQRMVNEARTLADTHRSFIELMKERSNLGGAQ